MCGVFTYVYHRLPPKLPKSRYIDHIEYLGLWKFGFKGLSCQIFENLRDLAWRVKFLISTPHYSKYILLVMVNEDEYVKPHVFPIKSVVVTWHVPTSAFWRSRGGQNTEVLS